MVEKEEALLLRVMRGLNLGGLCWEGVLGLIELLTHLLSFVFLLLVEVLGIRILHLFSLFNFFKSWLPQKVRV